jgi:hypothetical protein
MFIVAGFGVQSTDFDRKLCQLRVGQTALGKQMSPLVLRQVGRKETDEAGSMRKFEGLMQFLQEQRLVDTLFWKAELKTTRDHGRVTWEQRNLLDELIFRACKRRTLAQTLRCKPSPDFSDFGI